MEPLDMTEKFAALDSQNVRASVEALPEQCLNAWENVIRSSFEYGDCSACIVSGMGGSGLAVRVIESVYGQEMNIPLIRLQDYTLPKFANAQTLVICSSYSGNTEETLSVLEQALERKCKILCIAAGGKLEEISRAKGIPCLKIPSTYNPSGQPRMAVGYSLAMHLAVFTKLGLISLSEEEFLSSVYFMKETRRQYNWEMPALMNPAKQFAYAAYEKGILLCAAGHLAGSVHVLNNLLNENAKAFSQDIVIPEANHHLLEGFTHPMTNASYLHGFFVYSSLFALEIQRRMELTKEVMERNKVKTMAYNVPGETKLSQALAFIQFAAYANYYLAMLYNENPSPIPWVDFFKQQLQQQALMTRKV